MSWRGFAGWLLALAPLATATAHPKLSFTVLLDGLASTHAIITVSRLPGESWPLAVRGLPDGEQLSLHREGQAPQPGRDWTVRTPAVPGHSQLQLRRDSTGEIATIQLFSMHPLESVRDGKLNGFRVGRYPAQPLRGLSIYRPPRGLIELTAENADLAVSPHYRLGDFPSKQSGDYPKYLALRTRLLLKLEYLTEQAVAAGIAHGPFVIMSGYRTPYYNQAIGNRAYSRHQWGGAADIYIDHAPRDGRMDDLNGDGRSDRADAVFLARFFEGLSGRPEYREYVGGLGIYGANAHHGPFVHVDVRGSRARW